MYNFFRYPEERSQVTVTAKQSNADNYNHPKMAQKGSSEMPSYVCELYKQRGWNQRHKFQQNEDLKVRQQDRVKIKIQNLGYCFRTGRSISNYKANKQNGDNDDEQGIEESDNLIDR